MRHTITKYLSKIVCMVDNQTVFSICFLFFLKHIFLRPASASFSLCIICIFRYTVPKQLLSSLISFIVQLYRRATSQSTDVKASLFSTSHPHHHPCSTACCQSPTSHNWKVVSQQLVRSQEIVSPPTPYPPLNTHNSLVPRLLHRTRVQSYKHNA